MWTFKKVVFFYFVVVKVNKKNLVTLGLLVYLYVLKVEREKMGTAEDQNSMFSRLAGRVSKGGNSVGKLHVTYFSKFINLTVFISFLHMYSFFD